jgi:hypothetical protein
MVGRILWFRVDRFSVPCPRVIVITALPEDMPGGQGQGGVTQAQWDESPQPQL